MTRKETVEMLSLLRAAYPSFYSKIGKDQLEQIVSLWEEMFKEDDVATVKLALKNLISSHKGYPPDIATLKEKIDDLMRTVRKEPTDEELFRLLSKACENGFYGYREEFEKLPDVLKRYLGDPLALMEMATLPNQTFETVTKGQFLKEIKTVRARIRAEEALPAELKKLLSSGQNPFLSLEAKEKEE